MTGGGDPTPLAFGGFMAYIMRSRDKRGIVNIERVCDMVRTKLTEEQAQQKVQAHKGAASTHADAVKEDRHRNGWSGPKKMLRRFARVPADKMREFRAQADPNDHKALKNFIRENQYHTVDRNSF